MSTNLIRRTSAVFVPALTALFTLLLAAGNARAQVCDAGGSLGVGIYLDVAVAYVGDTVHITRTKLNLDSASCNASNGQAWVVYPDNHSERVNNNFTIFPQAGQTIIQCFFPPSGSDPSCQSITTAWLITSNNLGNQLTLTTNIPGGNSIIISSSPAASQVAFAIGGECQNAAAPTPLFPRCDGGEQKVLIVTPSITVTKFCVTNCPPNNSAVFGSPINIGGTICNNGDVALTNVVVTDDVGGTTISYATTTTLGNPFPATGGGRLAPGDCVTYAGSFAASGNGCGPYPDTVTACGTDDTPFPKQVCASASATCTVCTSPCIDVTANCDTVTLGAANTLSGSVSNCGNVTLVNVVITDSLYGPVATFASLAPHTSQSYSKTVTNSTSGTFPNVVTATGANLCGGGTVTDTANASCAVCAIPAITVTQHCPANPVAPGDLLIYSGTVSNSSNVTLTNVIVVNNRPTNNTPVLGPLTLIPGQLTNFTGSYMAPYDSCGPLVDTVTASGNELCTGSKVTATASAACPLVTTPRISVTRNCPPGPVTAGDLVFFTGVVSNSGNVTLGNVSVLDDQVGDVLDNLVLASGETAAFMSTYIPTNCGPNTVSGVTATGVDVCTGVVVSNRFVTVCAVACPPPRPVTPLVARAVDATLVLSFATETNRIYTVQFTDSLSPASWQTVTNFPGDGTVAPIRDSITNAQRFYRVLVQ